MERRAAGGAGTGAVRAVALSALSRLVLVLDREKSELQPLDLKKGNKQRERERGRERDVCCPLLVAGASIVAGAASGGGGARCTRAAGRGERWLGAGVEGISCLWLFFGLHDWHIGLGSLPRARHTGPSANVF